VKTILLLRHAKSDWGTPGQSDHERALNHRGARAALAIANQIARAQPHPDYILCSTAKRTRQTLAPLLQYLAPPPPVSFEKGLYLASEDTLLVRLKCLGDNVTMPLLIGHNDGIWLLAAALAGSGSSDARARLELKYPTGALATLRAPVTHWHDIRPGQCELVSFVTPREIGVT
jgi:phosphohistidine phosphatase